MAATLKIGSKGADVKNLQSILNSVGGYNLAVDGSFGNSTLNAVKDYQKKNGLSVDGIVGNNTWNLLNGAKNSATGNFSANNATADSGFKYDDFKYDAYKESSTVKAAQEALDAQLANKPSEYQSQWQSQLDETINKILNREDFSYDFNGDALYQQYKDKYIQQGKMAMQDAIGQASAMTGGYGNSYAATVGNQSYQASLQNLNDVIPELYQMAYDKYNKEGQDLYNQYALLGERESTDYGRYQDSVANWQAERDYLANRYDSERGFDYDKYTDGRDFAYGQYGDSKQYAYKNYRDQIEDEQWKKTFDEGVRQYNESLALQKKQAKTENNDEVDNDEDKNTSGELTYQSIVDDCNDYIASGASRSEISSYLLSAYRSKYITESEYKKLKSMFVPTSSGGHMPY